MSVERARECDIIIATIGVVVEAKTERERERERGKRDWPVKLTVLIEWLVVSCCPRLYKMVSATSGAISIIIMRV